MYGAHLRIAYTKGKEEKKIKTKLKLIHVTMSHVTDNTGIKSSINIFLLNYALYFV